MRGAEIAVVLATCACLIGGCVSPVQKLAASSRKGEEDMATNCRAWDAHAENAAHPDAKTIALHDRLAKTAADLGAAAAPLHGAALEVAMGKVAQAQIETDAVYDVQSKLKVASDCWRELELVKETHAGMLRRLDKIANQTEAVQGPKPVIRDPSIYTLHTQPPLPPQPMPLPNLGSDYVPNTGGAPSTPGAPGAFVGHVEGGPDVYVVPSEAIPPPPAPQWR